METFFTITKILLRKLNKSFCKAKIQIAKCMYKIIFILFTFSFLFIQPSKILADITGNKWFLGIFLAPMPFYFFDLIQELKKGMLKLHLTFFWGQVLLSIFYYTFFEIYLNKYTLFFYFTPHYFLMLKVIFKQRTEKTLLAKSLAIYITLTIILCVISINHYDSSLSIIDYLKNYISSTFYRNSTIDRWKLLEGMNYASILFGASPLTLEAVALTVYPLVLLSLIFLHKKDLLNSFAIKLGMVSSVILILLKNSRGEILYLLILFLYPFAKKIFEKFKPLILLAFPIGFIQLFLENRTLNGRGILNNFFSENITALGNGIGFTSNKINLLTKGDYSSFHNIHFELITNFGLIIYAILITSLSIYLLRRNYDKTKHLIICLYLFLMTTNFELFDIYFIVPLAMSFSSENEATN